MIIVDFMIDYYDVFELSWHYELILEVLFVSCNMKPVLGVSFSYLSLNNESVGVAPNEVKD